MCDLVSTGAHLGSLLSHHPHYHSFIVWKLVNEESTGESQPLINCQGGTGICKCWRSLQCKTLRFDISVHFSPIVLVTC